MFSELRVQDCCEDNISVTLPETVLTNHEKRKELGIRVHFLMYSCLISIAWLRTRIRKWMGSIILNIENNFIGNFVPCRNPTFNTIWIALIILGDIYILLLSCSTSICNWSTVKKQIWPEPPTSSLGRREKITLLPWRWTFEVHSECWYLSVKLRSIITPKITICLHQLLEPLTYYPSVIMFSTNDWHRIMKA
jgi:hypothetical protein